MTCSTYITELECLRLIEDKFSSQKRCILVALSGIDASGKTSLANRIHQELREDGIRSIIVGLDDWHNLAEIRFSALKPAENYYKNAYRFNDLFNKFILPLKRDGNLSISVDLVEPKTNSCQTQAFHLNDIQIILLEGIFLLRSEFMEYYDLSFWIECSVELATKRAITRNQENLAEREILLLYQSIFFPAQKIHLLKDKPLKLADGIILNNS